MKLKAKFLISLSSLLVITGSIFTVISCGTSSSTATTPIVSPEPTEEEKKITSNKLDINNHFATLSTLLTTSVKWASFNYLLNKTTEGLKYVSISTPRITFADNEAPTRIFDYWMENKKVHSLSAVNFSFEDFKSDMLKTGTYFGENKEFESNRIGSYSKIQPVISDSFIIFLKNNSKQNLLTHFYNPYSSKTEYIDKSYDKNFYNSYTNNSLDAQERVYLKASELVDLIINSNSTDKIKDFLDVFSVTRPKYDEAHQLPEFKAVNKVFEELQWLKEKQFLKDQDIKLTANDELNTVDVSLTLKTIYDETKEIKFKMTNVGVSNEYDQYLHEYYNFCMLTNTKPFSLITVYGNSTPIIISAWTRYILSMRSSLELTKDPYVWHWYEKENRHYEWSKINKKDFQDILGAVPVFPEDLTVIFDSIITDDEKKGTCKIIWIIKKGDIYFSAFTIISGFAKL